MVFKVRRLEELTKGVGLCLEKEVQGQHLRIRDWGEKVEKSAKKKKKKLRKAEKSDHGDAGDNEERVVKKPVTNCV